MPVLRVSGLQRHRRGCPVGSTDPTPGLSLLRGPVECHRPGARATVDNPGDRSADRQPPGNRSVWHDIVPELRVDAHSGHEHAAKVAKAQVSRLPHVLQDCEVGRHSTMRANPSTIHLRSTFNPLSSHFCVSVPPDVTMFHGKLQPAHWINHSESTNYALITHYSVGGPRKLDVSHIGLTSVLRTLSDARTKGIESVPKNRCTPCIP